MDFTIVIPCFNGPDRVDFLLESIFKFYPKANPSKIIVSDDCSPRMGEIRKVAEEKHKVIFTHPPKWVGVGGNRNHVIGLAEDNLVFVIDDDLVISMGTFETMQKFWEDNKHIKMGAVGFTFVQSHQMVERNIIQGIDKFYPPDWNNGKIGYNVNKFSRSPFLTHFVEPVTSSTPSGPCWSVNKTAWEESGRCHEFGMAEGGVFHDMWEKGWVIFIIPTPPLFHAKSIATNDKSDFLRSMYIKHPERRPYKHGLGEEMYKRIRGRYYQDDTDHIWGDCISPQKDKLESSVVFDFDAEGF